GEPAWDSPLGRGRPGWHIECSVIGVNHLGAPISVNGGGHDLLFPHHEFSAAHATTLTGTPWAKIRTHAGLLSLDGEKMSKSIGNLEFVSRLTTAGVDPRATRLALLAQHYRAHTEWTHQRLADAQQRLQAWASWSEQGNDARPVSGTDETVLARLRAALADDLDAPRAIRIIDSEIAEGNP